MIGIGVGLRVGQLLLQRLDLVREEAQLKLLPVFVSWKAKLSQNFDCLFPLTFFPVSFSLVVRHGEADSARRLISGPGETRNANTAS